jgi:hypothetical protein
MSMPDAQGAVDIVPEFPEPAPTVASSPAGLEESRDKDTRELPQQFPSNVVGRGDRLVPEVREAHGLHGA